MEKENKIYAELIGLLLVIIPILIATIWLIVGIFKIHYIFGLLVVGFISVMFGTAILSDEFKI